MAKPWQNPETLHELYIEKGLTQKEMANRLGCSDSTVSNYIREFGIERDETDKYPWRDAERLRRLYVEEELSIHEIADHLDTWPDIIHRWMVKHEIDRRPGPDADYPWQNEEIMRVLYEERGLSQREIAEKLDTTQMVISKWVRRHGIETPDKWYDAGQDARRKLHPYIYTDTSGYVIAGSRFGETVDQIRIHRLVAIAQYGIDAVKDKVVHHENEIPWDNRTSNLKLMTDSEHKSYHARNRSSVPEP